MNKIVYDLILKLEQCDDKHNRCDYLMEHDEITYLLDYITNLQQKYDKALEDSVKESHKRMELENTLHKIMVSDGEKTAPVLDLIKENERLKELDENYPIEEELAEAYRREEDYKSRCEKAVDYIEKHSNSFSVLDTISNGTLLNILNGEK